MSDAPAPSRSRRKRASTRVTAARIITVSVLAAGALTGGLAVQMASGHDPALGARQTATSSTGKLPKPAQPSTTVPTAPPPASVVTSSS